MSSVRVPTATYRVQLHRGFGFEAASAVAAYLYKLGISHVYCSPYLQAVPGSMHGYDVIDHQQVNDELGGKDGHEQFCKVLGENGLGQILDIVPNHMAIGSLNKFWWDVLENGVNSRYASFFDIDWTPHEERLRYKVLVPILSKQYGLALEAGEIQVKRTGAEFRVEVAGQVLPVSPGSLPGILLRAAAYSGSALLGFLSASYQRLPSPSLEDRETALARQRDKAVIEDLLSRSYSEDEGVSESVDRALRDLNVDNDALDAFLNEQNYRLAYWKTADQELGYRRFFDVNSLIGLRMERLHVFEETHVLILDWLHRGVIDGLRIDHPDGLRNPLQYFRRLRDAAPEAWIIGEKILAFGEFLRTGKRASWPIDGTSGYDFLNIALGLLIKRKGMAILTETYGNFTGEPTSFSPVAHDKRIAVAQEALGSDVNTLTSLFVKICESHRNRRDYTRPEVRRAIREIAACFDVYRTYVVPPERNVPGEIVAEDRRRFAHAIELAKVRRPDIDDGLFRFFEEVLTLEVTGPLESEFVFRFQQFTSPVMAKGVEDTAFYCYNRLTALCEVGGDPSRDGVSLDEFHNYQIKMQATHPSTMTTLSTHDTKRSDDVRARLAVLSEVPSDFRKLIRRWSQENEPHKTGAFPDPNTEYFLYQTLIGVWPIEGERLKAYMQKAMREAKQQTSWVAVNSKYEDALNDFIDRILASSVFVRSIEEFVSTILYPGRLNSLTQTLLKCTAPGVPDLYQGAELWDLSLVDPDNRRPVDYALRARLLDSLPTMTAGQILEQMDQGLPKLHVLHECLKLRRSRPDWFGPSAAYAPLQAVGRRARHVVSYRRANSVVTLAPRHSVTLSGWEQTTLELPSGDWVNRFTGEEIRGGEVLIESLLHAFPVGLFVRI